MTVQYTRARVDRASLEGSGPIRFVAATEGRQADGIDLRMEGARLDRYRNNPVVGFGHNYAGRDNLPIGRAVATSVDGDKLVIDVEFDRGDPFAVEVERKYRDGFLNAVSIGFTVKEWESPNDNYWSGGVAVGWELLELSAVPVPMDADAVVMSGRSIDKDSLRALVEEIVRSIASESTPDSVVEEPETSVREGLDPDAVRALLAAFSPKEGNVNE